MTIKIISILSTYYRQTIFNIMIQVIIACLPGIVTISYFFGIGVLIQLILACITSFIIEGIVLKLRHQSLVNLRDGSALLTAVLLAISIPPLCPWWIIVIGIIFSIIFAKQLYGGLGQNPFNPAMVGYVVLLISFPVQMTSWLPQQDKLLYPLSFLETLILILTERTPEGLSLQQIYYVFDGITQATPLDNFKTNFVLNKSIFENLFLINSSYIYINISFLLGGLYMLWRRIINGYISLSFLFTILLLSILESWLISLTNISIVLHLFFGATMFGAFFIATDPVTSATTNIGKLIFGSIIGLLVWIIRTWGGYPDSIAFAVLLANTCVPLIDHYTKPSIYGKR